MCQRTAARSTSAGEKTCTSARLGSGLGTFTDARVTAYGKQDGSLRVVPLPLRASESLGELPPRIDTPLLFPDPRGGHLNLNRWRRDE